MHQEHTHARDIAPAPRRPPPYTAVLARRGRPTSLGPCVVLLATVHDARGPTGLRHMHTVRATPSTTARPTASPPYPLHIAPPLCPCCDHVVALTCARTVYPRSITYKRLSPLLVRSTHCRLCPPLPPPPSSLSRLFPRLLNPLRSFPRPRRSSLAHLLLRTAPLPVGFRAEADAPPLRFADAHRAVSEPFATSNCPTVTQSSACAACLPTPVTPHQRRAHLRCRGMLCKL